MTLQELLDNLNQQIEEHQAAATSLEGARTAVEEAQSVLSQRQSVFDEQATATQAEKSDVVQALTSVRDWANEELARLQEGEGTPPTEPSATEPEQVRLERSK